MYDPIHIRQARSWRDFQRSIILVSCGFALMIGLPQLAFLFRPPPNPVNENPHAALSEAMTAKNSASGLALTAQDFKETPLKNAVAQERAAIGLQAAQDVLNARAPSTVVYPSEDGLSGEGYLPPWDALRETYPQMAEAAAPPPPEPSPAPAESRPLAVQATVRRAHVEASPRVPAIRKAPRAEVRKAPRKEYVKRREPEKRYATSRRRSAPAYPSFASFFGW